MSDERLSIGEPHDRLTRMCDAMVVAFEAHPEYQPGDRCIVFLDDERRGGLVLHGYEEAEEFEAVIRVLDHVRAMLAVRGISLEVHPMRVRGRDEP